MVPNVIDLTSLAAVKARAEVRSTGDDTEIQGAITGFSQWFLNRCGMASLNSVVTLDELYCGNGNNILALRTWPVRSLTGVTINGVSVPLSSGYASWGAYVDHSKKFIGLRGGAGNFSTFPYPDMIGGPYRGLARGPVFSRGQDNVEVQYTAGVLPVTVSNEVDTISSQTIALQQGPWVSDGGVAYYPSLVPLTSVPSAPASGEYAVSNGLYVFNPSDDGAQVAVTYSVNQAPYDLEYAVRCVVAINYKRKGWQDQASRGQTASGASSTTRYQSWDWPPEYENIFRYYTRLSPS